MTTPTIDAIGQVPARPVRLVAALTALAWFGMFLHDWISLPELNFMAPEILVPTVVAVALFGAWWAWPGRLSSGLLFSWTLLNLAVGGILSVLPLPFWPFVPEQTVRHYAAHVLYVACQLPLLYVLIRARPGPAESAPSIPTQGD